MTRKQGSDSAFEKISASAEIIDDRENEDDEIQDDFGNDMDEVTQNQVKILDTAMSHIMPPKFVQVGHFFLSAMSLRRTSKDPNFVLLLLLLLEKNTPKS